ncbi:hypothetical protein ACSBR2_027632 [Camellia fascicularis]
MHWLVQMNSFFILLCCYQSINIAYELQPPYNFAKLVDFIFTKYDGLLPGRNMVCHARSFWYNLLMWYSNNTRVRGTGHCWQ